MLKCLRRRRHLKYKKISGKTEPRRIVFIWEVFCNPKFISFFRLTNSREFHLIRRTAHNFLVLECLFLFASIYSNNSAKVFYFPCVLFPFNKVMNLCRDWMNLGCGRKIYGYVLFPLRRLIFNRPAREKNEKYIEFYPCII